MSWPAWDDGGVTTPRWPFARTALRDAGERFRGLLTTAPDPRAMATADWTIADSAAHVLTIALLYVELVNELLVHGWDMARAARRPWALPDEEAALYWELFFLGMLRLDYGTLLNTSLPMPRRPIAVRFRSAHTPEATVTLGDGRVFIAGDDAPYDVRVTFRPGRFNLMLFGRISTAQAALRRDVVVGGPRPWRLPAFLRVVHMPNARLAP